MGLWKVRKAIMAELTSRYTQALKRESDAERSVVAAAMRFRASGGRHQADLLDACDALARARDATALQHRAAGLVSREVG